MYIEKINKTNTKSKKSFAQKAGFTLLEMLISVSLFTVVVTIAFSALLTIMDANEKAKTIKLVVNNLSMAMESMTREIRVGYQYTCNTNTPETEGRDCSTGANKMSLKTKDGEDVLYSLSNNTIERKTGTGTPVAILGSDISIDGLKFYVQGSGSEAVGSAAQPRVLIVLNGSITRANIGTVFNIQTTVSQRKLAP